MVAHLKKKLDYYTKDVDFRSRRRAGVAFSATTASSGVGVALLELGEYGSGLTKGVLTVKLATDVAINSAIKSPDYSDPANVGQALLAPIKILGAGVRDTVTQITLKEFVSPIDEAINTPAY